MNIEKMREEFEVAVVEMHFQTGMPIAIAKTMLERNRNGQYSSLTTLGAWWGWQASRQSLVIELPERLPIDHRGDYWDGARNGFNQCIDTCANSIRLAGVKCEVKL